MISNICPVSYNRHSRSLLKVYIICHIIHHLYVHFFAKHRIPLNLDLKTKVKKSWLYCGRKKYAVSRGCKTGHLTKLKFVRFSTDVYYRHVETWYNLVHSLQCRDTTDMYDLLKCNADVHTRSGLKPRLPQIQS